MIKKFCLVRFSQISYSQNAPFYEKSGKSFEKMLEKHCLMSLPIVWGVWWMLGRYMVSENIKIPKLAGSASSGGGFRREHPLRITPPPIMEVQSSLGSWVPRKFKVTGVVSEFRAKPIRNVQEYIS